MYIKRAWVYYNNRNICIGKPEQTRLVPTYKKQFYKPCHNIRQEPIFIHGLRSRKCVWYTAVEARREESCLSSSTCSEAATELHLRFLVLRPKFAWSLRGGSLLSNGAYFLWCRAEFSIAEYCCLIKQQPLPTHK